jgi:hypothetical protein
MTKRCAKCDKPIAKPVLGNDPSELCHGCSFAHDPGSAIDAGFCKRCWRRALSTLRVHHERRDGLLRRLQR